MCALSNSKMCVRAQSCLTLLTLWTEPGGILCPWNFPGKNTGADCHFLLPGDLLNPGIEPMSFASLALAGGFFTTAPKSKQEMVIVVMSIFEICFESCYSVPYNVCHQYAMSFQVCGQYMSSFPNPQSNPCSHLPVVLAYPLEYN